MRLLDTYALASGSTIDKPFIFEHFFPIPFDKYVTFQAQTKFSSKDYSYWQDVINLIFPVLDKLGIKIIQVGIASEFCFRYCVDLRGRTDFNQLAYVISNSSLHFGSDSLGVHLASSYDIPIVGLYSVSQASVSGPHFGNKNKQIVIESFLRTRTGKPSYSDKENPKCIDLIKPEEIANSIFKLLGIDNKVPFETIFMGEKYGPRIIRELVPSKPISVDNPEAPIEIRMDINFDEKALVEQLSRGKAIIVTDKRINKDILRHFKPVITALIYDVTENDEPNFIKDIKDLGLNVVFITSLPEDKLCAKKLNYYDFGKIHPLKEESPEIVKEIKDNMESLWFKSNKVVFEGDKIYMGQLSRLKGKEFPSDFDYIKAEDDPVFWKELSFMTLVKRLDNPKKT